MIVKLPLSNGYDSILVVVDRLTKMTHLIPTNESIIASGVAKLYLDNIFWLLSFGQMEEGEGKDRAEQQQSRVRGNKWVVEQGGIVERQAEPDLAKTGSQALD
jgi:hypothetical protein